MSEDIVETGYVINQTYYLFSDNSLTSQYMKHIATNSSNVDEALRKIKRIEDRVISLSNYAKMGLENSLSNDNKALLYDKNGVNFNSDDFTRIDRYFNGNENKETNTYLSNNAGRAELQSIIRQCEAIRIGSVKMAKMASNYYFMLNIEKVKMDKATRRNLAKQTLSSKDISFTNVPRTLSIQ
ncbi:hypothetical protein GZ989_011350 (plasmid) [Campylobacter fetus]|uniref:Uncharacterized protein n=1 Tax=Campylobacter fetus TaxID=196 RepID=A0A974MV04_CAMFE|nr:hypothetical protein [Campylobacter fetus]OCS32899.1 hypothetical protein AWR31_08145 [Campylobacter fetus subsp. venerealis]QMS59902.1 hypothetical protein GZ989_011350 [Campylobacter fetus]